MFLQRQFRRATSRYSRWVIGFGESVEDGSVENGARQRAPEAPYF